MHRTRAIREGVSHVYQELPTSLLMNRASARRVALWKLKLGATQQLELGSCGISDNKNNTYTPPATAPPSSYESPDYDNNSSSLEVFQTLKMTDKSNRHSSSRSKKKPPPPLEPIKVDSESDRFRDLAPPSPASCPSTPENANGVWVWPSRVDVSETARGDNGRKHSKKDGGVTEFVVVSAMDEGKRSNEDDVSRKPSITVNTSFASSCSTAVLTEVAREHQPANTFVGARETKPNKRSSIDGGALDAPFLSHLCDMSKRFPEPPIAPPSSQSKAMNFSKSGLKALDFGLPLLVSTKLRNRMLISMTARCGTLRTIRSSPARVDPPLSQRRPRRPRRQRRQSTASSNVFQHRHARAASGQLVSTAPSRASPPLPPASSASGQDIETQWPVVSKVELTIACETPPSQEETRSELIAQARVCLTADEPHDNGSPVSGRQEKLDKPPFSPCKVGGLGRFSHNRRPFATDLPCGDVGDHSPIQMKRMSFAGQRVAQRQAMVGVERRSFRGGFRMPLNSSVAGSGGLEEVAE